MTPTTPPTPRTENELKTAVLQLARRNGWAVYHVPQARMRNGGGAGFPDLTMARDGEILFIELKQRGENPTSAQLDWAAALGRSWHLIRPADWDSGRVGELLR